MASISRWFVLTVVLCTACAGRGRGGSESNSPLAAGSPDAAGQPSTAAPGNAERGSVRDLRAIASAPTPADEAKLLEALKAEQAEDRRLGCQGLGLLAPPAALEPLYWLARQDPDPTVAAAADRAMQSYPMTEVTAVELRCDPMMKARTQARDAAESLRFAAVDRRLARMKPPVDEWTMQTWAKERDPNVGLEVYKPELVRDHAPAGHPLGYNNQANAGELLEYRLPVANLSTAERRSSSAYCYTFDTYCTVINRKLMLPPMAPSARAAILDTLLVLVSPDAPEQHEARFYLEVGDTELDAQHGGKPVYRTFTLQFTNRGFGPVTFEFGPVDDDTWGASDGNGNRVPEWGEKIEITVFIKNLGSTPLNGAKARISSLSSLATVIARPAVAVDLQSRGRNRVGVTFGLVLAGGYNGRFDLPLRIDVTVPYDPVLAGEATAESTRSYLSQNKKNTESSPKTLYTFSQVVQAHVGVGAGAAGSGDEQVTAIGLPTVYRPFEVAKLVTLFIRNEDPRTQIQFLELNETAFWDKRDTLAAAE